MNACIIDHRAGDLICVLCGTVNKEHIQSVGYHTRTETNVRNVIAVPMRTYVGKRNDGKGSLLQRTLNKNHRQLQLSTDRQLQVLYENCEEIACRMNINKRLLNQAKGLALQFHARDGKPVKKNKVIAAACLCIACRRMGMGRSIKEFVQTGLVKKREMGYYLKQVSRFIQVATQGATPAMLLPRYANKLNASHETLCLARGLSDGIRKMNMMGGRSPHSVVALVLYVALRVVEPSRKTPLKHISVAVGIASNTSGHCLEILKEKHAAVRENTHWRKKIYKTRYTRLFVGMQ
jgi:transcription initiation factor TFIIIB Brf1 subunit/transcription initiation factor TFIIB